jgi:hypothetical protein
MSALLRLVSPVTFRLLAALVGGAIGVVAASARAGIATEDLTFSGPQQSATLSVRINNGSASLNGFGDVNGVPLLLNPNPQNIPLALNPNPTVFNSTPTGLAAQVQIDDHTGQVQGISQLSMDLLSGRTAIAHLQEQYINVTLGGSPLALPLDATFVFHDLQLANSKVAVINGNHFSIYGQALGLVDITATILGQTVLQVYNSYISPNYEFITLSGTVSTTPGTAPHSENILLDGSGSLAITDVLSTQLTASLGWLNFTGIAAVTIPVVFDVNFHLEADPLLVPEPSTAGLLLVGLGTMVLLRPRGRSARR